MLSFLVSFLSGFLVSLSGGIAPSNMSAIAMELTIDRSKKAGLWFGLGAACVETVYIRLYFWGFDAFISKHYLFIVLQWIMIGLFFIIGIVVFRRTLGEPKRRQRKRKDFSKYNATKSFLLGCFLKAINPLQFVFWTFWSTYLLANNWLRPHPVHYNVFCIGLGLATFVGYALYVFLGDYLENRSFFSKKMFQRIIGAFLSLTSIAWAIKLLIKPEGMII